MTPFRIHPFPVNRFVCQCIYVCGCRRSVCHRYCSACVSSDSVSANLRFLPESGGDATAAATTADGADGADGADDVDDGTGGCVAVEVEDEAEERSEDGTVSMATAAAEDRFFFLGRSGRLHKGVAQMGRMRMKQVE